MILSVTLNLAIDKVARTTHLNPGGETRVDLVTNLPGGKGINAARAIRSLGGEVAVTGLAGGKNGSFIEEGLKQEGITPFLFPMESENRVCLIIVDHEKQVSEIYERGMSVPLGIQRCYLDYFDQCLPQASYTMVSGSLPLGFPPDYYYELLSHTVGHRCLDSHGPQVLHALRHDLFLLKINEREFLETFGLQELSRGIRHVIEHYPVQHLVVTLGANGALTWDGSRVIRLASSAQVEVKCPVGAGDTFLGSLVFFMETGHDFLNAARRATAASMSNVTLYQGGEINLPEFERILPTVEVEAL
jgi:tagatose 6-phosphate kinase